MQSRCPMVWECQTAELTKQTCVFFFFISLPVVSAVRIPLSTSQSVRVWGLGGSMGILQLVKVREAGVFPSLTLSLLFYQQYSFHHSHLTTRTWPLAPDRSHLTALRRQIYFLLFFSIYRVSFLTNPIISVQLRNATSRVRICIQM